MAEREWLDSFPSGYRFKPSDHELLQYYLKRKLFNKLLPRNLINEVHLYNFVPEDLVAQHPSYGEGEWYYFTPRDKKYPNGKRPNRAAGNGDGYWKATGADRKVEVNGVEIGSRKALVYYRGRPPKGNKTVWMMHEYVLKDAPGVTHNDNKRLNDWVLCKIYKKKTEKQTDNHAQDVADVLTASPSPSPSPSPSLAAGMVTAVASPVASNVAVTTHALQVAPAPVEIGSLKQPPQVDASPMVASTPLFESCTPPPLAYELDTFADGFDALVGYGMVDYGIDDIDYSFLNDGPDVDDAQDPPPPLTQ